MTTRSSDSRLRRIARIALVSCPLVALLLVFSCAERRELSLEEPASLFQPEAGQQDGSSPPDANEAAVLLCPSSECVPPYATCGATASSLGVPPIACQIDLRTDPKHCGACTTICAQGGLYSCPDLETDPLNCGSCGFLCPGRARATEYVESGKHGQFECARARCEFQCRAPWSDCNNDDADGCEANLQFDPNNCGACGSKCIPGQLCIEGKCAVRECEGGMPR